MSLTAEEITAPGRYTVSYQRHDRDDRVVSWTDTLGQGGGTATVTHEFGKRPDGSTCHWQVVTVPHDDDTLAEFRSLVRAYRGIVRPAGHPKCPAVPDRYEVMRVVADVIRGTVLTTDDLDEAIARAAQSPDLAVVDSVTGHFLAVDGEAAR